MVFGALSIHKAVLISIMLLTPQLNVQRSWETWQTSQDLETVLSAYCCASFSLLSPGFSSWLTMCLEIPCGKFLCASLLSCLLRNRLFKFYEPVRNTCLAWSTQTCTTFLFPHFTLVLILKLLFSDKHFSAPVWFKDSLLLLLLMAAA